MQIVMPFEKIDGLWYAEIPEYTEGGGNQADLLMVMGADLWLESHAHGAERMVLKIADMPFEGMVLNPAKSGCLQQSPPRGMGWYVDSRTGMVMWLCEVTEWVFGGYPDEIHYYFFPESEWQTRR